MNAMIERVAEKLYDYDASCADYRWSSWNFAAVNKQQKYRVRANVCIEAMCEPTDVMLDAGEAICVKHCALGSQMPHIWRAFIDEALK